MIFLPFLLPKRVYLISLTFAITKAFHILNLPHTASMIKYVPAGYSHTNLQQQLETTIPLLQRESEWKLKSSNKATQTGPLPCLRKEWYVFEYLGIIRETTSTLHNGKKKVPKRNNRSRLGGQYLGVASGYASNVSHILTKDTGFISPQYHVVHDDFFTTVPASMTRERWADLGGLTQWETLYEFGRENYIDVVPAGNNTQNNGNEDDLTGIANIVDTGSAGTRDLNTVPPFDHTWGPNMQASNGYKVNLLCRGRVFGICPYVQVRRPVLAEILE